MWMKMPISLFHPVKLRDSRERELGIVLSFSQKQWVLRTSGRTHHAAVARGKGQSSLREQETFARFRVVHPERKGQGQECGVMSQLGGRGAQLPRTSDVRRIWNRNSW